MLLPSIYKNYTFKGIRLRFYQSDRDKAQKGLEVGEYWYKEIDKWFIIFIN